MEYRLIQVYPPSVQTSNPALDKALASGWQLSGGPVAVDGELFQAVTRSTKLKEPAGGPEAQKAAASLKEPAKGGSLSHG